MKKDEIKNVVFCILKRVKQVMMADTFLNIKISTKSIGIYIAIV